MNLIRILSLLVGAVTVAASAEPTHPLVADLVQEVERSDGLLRLKQRSFSKYVLQNDRPYNLIVYVGADAGYCAACQRMLKTLRAAIPKIFQATGTQNFVNGPDGIPTFFAYLEATAEREITRMLGLTFIPQMIRITPSNVKCLTSEGKRRLDLTRSARGDTCTVSSANGLTIEPDPESEKQLVEALATQIGLPDLPAKVFPPSRKKMYIGGAILLVGLTVAVLNLDRLQNYFIHHQPIIAFIGLVSFTLSTSGIIYNLQHGMQWTGTDPQTRQTAWISRQGRTQYLAEGLMFSGLTEIFCLALWLSVNVTPAMRRLKGTVWVAKYGVALKMISGVLMIGAYIAFRTLSATVIMKHPFLRPSFFPDQGFVRGAIRNDRMYGI